MFLCEERKGGWESFEIVVFSLALMVTMVVICWCQRLVPVISKASFHNLAIVVRRPRIQKTRQKEYGARTERDPPLLVAAYSVPISFLPASEHLRINLFCKRWP